MRQIVCLSTEQPLIDLREEDICPALQKPMVIITIGIITALLILFAVLGKLLD